MTVSIELILGLVLSVLAVLVFFSGGLRRVNKQFIADYEFPSSVTEYFQSKHGQLSDKDIDEVLDGLRQFYLVCGMNKLRWCSMPSKLIDEAWHQHILETKAYQSFCKNAFGKFLHHTPAKAMRNQKQAQLGIRRAWRKACQLEGIDPNAAHAIPLLFALDYKHMVSEGYYYVLNCEMPNFEKAPQYYCAGHISVATSQTTCGTGCGGGCGGG